MKPKGYLFFHLNLAFSSIEEEAWADVIRTCYHPMLHLIEKTGIPVGIELTGWTLKQIERIDPSWVEKFKGLLDSKSCELIGSGYCQIIGPLAPYNVNEWNQIIGLEIYKQVLNYRPKVALVNEMAFSSSMVDLYNKFGYEGFIMDRDNIKLALSSDKLSFNKIPTHAIGVDGSVMTILWSDSILFQKVQHFAHGDISIKDYLGYLKKRIDREETVLPLYSNDAEVFDYRPGRFSEERPTHPEGEWRRIERLLNSITCETEIEFISPIEALKISNKEKNRFESKLVNASYPIPVKKQEKYNIARWAVTGRNDVWLNTMCHRIESHLAKSKNNNINDWASLCELWASDLRTHITDKRWNKAISQIDGLLNQHKINSNFGQTLTNIEHHTSLTNVIGQYGDALIGLDDEGILLSICTKYLKLTLNLRRGLAIQSLAFASHNMDECLGTLSHGHFQCISVGADYYSGGIVIELPLLRKRVTDLERVEPKFLIRENGNIEIYAEIKTQFGKIIKIIEVCVDSEKVSLSYNFSNWDKVFGSVRLGILTLLNQFNHKNTNLLFTNGGKTDEIFHLNSDFNHTKPSSTLVSSSRGLGATTGKIQIINNKKSINLQWDPRDCAVMPMLQNNTYEDKTLSRIFFSTQEIDDTLKFPLDLKGFSLSIST